jgi:hypothetical protein
MGVVESRVALEAGSVSACSGTVRPRAVAQLTGCLVERSIHVAVNDAGLEASVCIAKRNRGAHDTLVIALKQRCLRSSVSWSSAGLSLAVRAVGLQAFWPPNLPHHSNITTIGRAESPVYKIWHQILRYHSVR